MPIFVPQDFLDDQENELLGTRIDDLVRAVRAMKPTLVAVANEIGAKEITAASQLMRGIQLVADARAGPRAKSPIEIASRTMFECAVRGRFLLVHKDGADEFIRMCNYMLKREQVSAKRLGTRPPGLPSFLAHIQPEPSDPRDLASICARLDELDGYDGTEQLSSTMGYALFGGALSDTAVHAGLQALKRFSTNDGGLLKVTGDEPLFTKYPAVSASAWLGDLALDVATTFGIDPTSILSTEVHRPPRVG